MILGKKGGKEVTERDRGREELQKKTYHRNNRRKI